MPIFRVKSVKIYTGQKNLHGYSRGARNKYQVCICHHTIETNRDSADKGGDGKKQVHVEGLLLKKWTSG